MNTTGFRRLLLVLLAGAIVAACGGGRPQGANTFNYFHPAKIKGLDPIHSDDLYSGREVSRAYEGLLGYVYLKRPYSLEPQLAESLPTLSPDGRVYTFTLKSGVMFQDDPAFKATGGKGREVVADDFVYSLKRLADPKEASPGWWILDGKVIGLNEWREAASKAGVTDYARPIEGLKALDRRTLQITLIKPSHQFLYNIAQRFAAVVPREAVEMYGPEFLNHAVGTGPYRLEEFTPGRLTWIRNPTFRRVLYPTEGEPGDREKGLLEDAGKPIPFIDRIVVNIYEETQPMWLNFLAGNLDVAVIPKDNYAQAIDKDGNLMPELAAKGIKLYKSPLLDLTFTNFNMFDPIVGKNKYLRQAISLAHDITTTIDLFYNGRAIPAQGPIPPGLSGYDPAFRNPYLQHNVEKAKELMVKAGYPGGKGLPPLQYLTMADSTSRQMTELEQKNLAAIGIRLQVASSSWPELQQAVKNKKGQIWGMAWGADYPDAENFLQLFYGKNISPGPNDGNYVNPVYDKLYEEALALPDSPARTEIYKKMVAILVEDCPRVFGVHRLQYALTQGRVRNFKPSEFEDNTPKYLRLETAN